MLTEVMFILTGALRITITSPFSISFRMRTSTIENSATGWPSRRLMKAVSDHVEYLSTGFFEEIDDPFARHGVMCRCKPCEWRLESIYAGQPRHMWRTRSLDSPGLVLSNRLAIFLTYSYPSWSMWPFSKSSSGFSRANLNGEYPRRVQRQW